MVPRIPGCRSLPHSGLERLCSAAVASAGRSSRPGRLHPVDLPLLRRRRLRLDRRAVRARRDAR